MPRFTSSSSAAWHRPRTLAALAALTLLAPAVLIGLAAAPAHAQVTVFTDRASFNAVASGLTTIDFNDQVPAGQTDRNYGSSVTLSGVTFTANIGFGLYAINPSYGPSYGLGDSTVLGFFFGMPDVLTVTLPSDITAFGFDYGGPSFNGAVPPFVFTLPTGEVYTYTPTATPTNTPSFIGFTSQTPFTSLTVTTPSYSPQIDRFAFGTNARVTAAAVPEPSEYAMAGMFGATLLIGMARTRRKKVAQATSQA